MTFDEAKQLRRALRYGQVTKDGNHYFSDSVCELILRELRTVDWLGFPADWCPKPRPPEPMVPGEGTAPVLSPVAAKRWAAVEAMCAGS